MCVVHVMARAKCPCASLNVAWLCLGALVVVAQVCLGVVSWGANLGVACPLVVVRVFWTLFRIFKTGTVWLV